MSFSRSHLTTLRTSATCSERSILGCSRWARSPWPVRVGVNTVCPRALSRSATRRQHQPPCQAPCTRRKVFEFTWHRPRGEPQEKLVSVEKCGDKAEPLEISRFNWEVF